MEKEVYEVQEMSVSLKAAVGVLFICIQSVSCSVDLGDLIDLDLDPVDLAGDWSITEEALGDVSGSCYSPGQTQEYTITIEQTNNLIVVIGFEGTSVPDVGLLGFISGHTVGFDWAIEDSGQLIEVVGELEVSSDEDFMEGDLVFTLTGTGGPCSGTFHITAVRQQPLVAGDSPQVATLINVHDSSDAVVFMRPAGQPSITPIYLGSVAPGGTVVFPLPKGSWIVSYTHLSDGDSHFESLGMWNSLEEWEGRASSESGSTGTSIGAATSTSPGR